MQNLKTLPPIEPNVGSRKKFGKALERISQAFFLRITDDLLGNVVGAGLAQDASPKTLAERIIRGARAKQKTGKVVYVRRDLESVSAEIDAIISQNLGEWVTSLGQAVSEAVKRYARTVLLEVSADQKRALTVSGFPVQVIDDTWTVPVIRGRYVSAQAQLQIEKLAQEATDSICRGYANGIEQVRQVLLESLEKGQDLRELARAISLVDVVRKRRSEFDAIDVSNRFVQSVEMANSMALGIRQGIWIHVPGAYTSRETHKHFNGKVFDLDKGIYDPDYKGFVRPGELRFCRCIYRQVLPNWVAKK